MKKLYQIAVVALLCVGVTKASDPSQPVPPDVQAHRGFQNFLAMHRRILEEMGYRELQNRLFSHLEDPQFSVL